mgnify:CR=1 FL=1
MEDSYNQAVRSALQPGEYVLWEGAPRKGMRLQKSDVFLIPFSLFWCGFAGFWEYTVIAGGGPLIMALFGIPFILVGLYLLFGRFVSRARSLSSTHYVVTDQRLLFLYRKNTQFLLYQNIETLEKEQTKDDRGTIYFFPRNFYYQDYRRTASYHGNANLLQGRAFEDIEDVERVYRLIEGKVLEAARVEPADR